jgi:hypothetical protein
MDLWASIKDNCEQGEMFCSLEAHPLGGIFLGYSVQIVDKFEQIISASYIGQLNMSGYMSQFCLFNWSSSVKQVYQHFENGKICVE